MPLCSLLVETTTRNGAVVQDQRLYVFRYLPRNPRAANPTFQYVVKNWDTLWNSCVVVNMRSHSHYFHCRALRLDGIDAVVYGSTVNFNTKEQLDMVSIKRALKSA